MSKWIDAEWLLNRYKGHHDFYLNAWGGDFKAMDAKDKARCDELNTCIADIFNAPSIDIIRCGECKYAEYRADYNDCECHYSGCGLVYEVDDFCSYGEREGE